MKNEHTCIYCSKTYYDELEFDYFCDDCNKLQEDNYIGNNDNSDDIPDEVIYSTPEE